MLSVTPYVLYGTSYTLRVMWDELRATWVIVNSYVLRDTWVYVTCYAVRLSWVSLYDFPPLVACKGRFSCRKWFCFLDLKIKNGWWFHFRNSKFSGKGNKGKY